jgi:hypothetical protein
MTVTASGIAIIPPDEQPTSVYAVQLQGPIDGKDPSSTFDGYVAKLERIRMAVIAAGVPESDVTKVSYSASPTSPTIVSFNSIFRYEVKTGPTAVAAAQAAFGAGATMVYSNMPTPPVRPRRPDPVKLEVAVAEATAMARDHAVVAARGRSVEDAIATTLVVKGEPESAPQQWRIEVTVTFAVR